MQSLAMLKTCRRCEASKPIDDFVKDRNTCLECRKLYKIKSRYGISKDIFEAVALSQAGKCKVCSRESELVVDHCHFTGAVRGLLCEKCNMGIGLLNEDISTLTQAIDYLKRNK